LISYQAVYDDATTLKSDRDGFVRAYQEAFGGAPYFEHYSKQEVLDKVWYPHVEDGIIVLAIGDQRVIGFGCALPLSKAPEDIQEFLAPRRGTEEFPVDYDRTWYMSELGVLEAHRGRGHGYELVRHRLLTISHRGDTHYTFRTAAEGSNSIHLYRKIGAHELPELQDVSTSEQVQINDSQSPRPASTSTVTASRRSRSSRRNTPRSLTIY
jgi:ribosomal protein S18 acetylase RimI-like enzyme